MKQKLCNKPILPAKNGKSRGTCIRPLGHQSRCGSRTCFHCAIKLTKYNTLPEMWNKGRCKKCHREYQQKWTGRKPQVNQKSGQMHTFRRCDCTGVLPKSYTQSNKFAVGNKRSKDFSCRVSAILHSGDKRAHYRGYEPVSPKTPHSIIRKMMDDPNCERCKQPLKWEFGVSKTPHLHHNHETGEPYGFTHPKCNPRAMENEIEFLRKENQKLSAIPTVW